MENNGYTPGYERWVKRSKANNETPGHKTDENMSENPGEFILHCFNCLQPGLSIRAVPHRMEKKIVGFVYVCQDCYDIVRGEL
jgi:hypothetical protein